jgi:hypothetical protein
MVAFGAPTDATTWSAASTPTWTPANGGNDDPLITGLRALGHTREHGAAKQRHRHHRAAQQPGGASTGRRRRPPPRGPGAGRLYRCELSTVPPLSRLACAPRQACPCAQAGGCGLPAAGRPCSASGARRAPRCGWRASHRSAASAPSVPDPVPGRPLAPVASAKKLSPSWGVSGLTARARPWCARLASCVACALDSARRWPPRRWWWRCRAWRLMADRRRRRTRRRPHRQQRRQRRGPSRPSVLRAGQHLAGLVQHVADGVDGHQRGHRHAAHAQRCRADAALHRALDAEQLAHRGAQAGTGVALRGGRPGRPRGRLAGGVAGVRRRAGCARRPPTGQTAPPPARWARGPGPRPGRGRARPASASRRRRRPGRRRCRPSAARRARGPRCFPGAAGRSRACRARRRARHAAHHALRAQHHAAAGGPAGCRCVAGQQAGHVGDAAGVQQGFVRRRSHARIVGRAGVGAMPAAPFLTSGFADDFRRPARPQANTPAVSCMRADTSPRWCSVSP